MYCLQIINFTARNKFVVRNVIYILNAIYIYFVYSPWTSWSALGDSWGKTLDLMQSLSGKDKTVFLTVLRRFTAYGI